MKQEPLRSEHCDRRLLSDERCGVEGGLDDLVSSAVDSARDEANRQGLGHAERARCERELRSELLVPSYLGEPGKRPNVCSKANINFLQ